MRSASGRLAARDPGFQPRLPRGVWRGCFRGPKRFLRPGRPMGTQPPSPTPALGTWFLLWVVFLGLEPVSLLRPKSAL